MHTLTKKQQQRSLVAKLDVPAAILFDVAYDLLVELIQSNASSDSAVSTRRSLAYLLQHAAVVCKEWRECMSSYRTVGLPYIVAFEFTDRCKGGQERRSFLYDGIPQHCAIDDTAPTTLVHAAEDPATYEYVTRWPAAARALVQQKRGTAWPVTVGQTASVRHVSEVDVQQSGLPAALPHAVAVWVMLLRCLQRRLRTTQPPEVWAVCANQLCGKAFYKGRAMQRTRASEDQAWAEFGTLSPANGQLDYWHTAQMQRRSTLAGTRHPSPAHSFCSGACWCSWTTALRSWLPLQPTSAVHCLDSDASIAPMLPAVRIERSLLAALRRNESIARHARALRASKTSPPEIHPVQFADLVRRQISAVNVDVALLLASSQVAKRADTPCHRMDTLPGAQPGWRRLGGGWCVSLKHVRRVVLGASEDTRAVRRRLNAVCTVPVGRSFVKPQYMQDVMKAATLQTIFPQNLAPSHN